MAGEQKVLMLCAVVVFCWLAIGTFVYKLAGNCLTNTSCSPNGQLVETPVCGWTLGESYYYSVQAGLSIGFGLLPETEPGSRLYTVFHILAGSSFIGGALALFVTLAITRHRARHDRTEKLLTQYCQKVHVDGYKGFTLEELRGLVRTHPRFYRDMLELVEDDPNVVERRLAEFKAMKPGEKNKAADDLITEAHGKVDSLKGGRLTIDDLENLNKQERKLSFKVKSYVIENWSFVLVWSLWFFWMLIGTIYGLVAEKWTFIQSVYFAVSTCSTAGLQGVTRESFAVLFAGTYSLVGVPLHAAALGTFANLIVDRYNSKVFDEKLAAKVETAEITFVEHINENHAGKDFIDQTEFIEVQLLKLGKVDRDLLKQLRDQFKDLDKEGSGMVKKDIVIETDERRMQRIARQKQKNQQGAQP
mmetsp:Transcript_88916/g.236176  ORF Transcript_88916/g.236176 Transcript_88916/m.236176 type:complete len:417 (-) Transcript_88916:65-1315(-)|eukprot:CAMPEP_0171238724 /NCGR_PEP_ID=MMETSP0790-20130122/43617_1 /TAXON_ID=2925 /ORGANISM="Alexandrium catenella, Strain OF101" /LENGTH=416 /DNA_ID=CAMNT_0011705091 /DNA_START=79 /DNA_END=1329 /DNA_ORIENTATION=+